MRLTHTGTIAHKGYTIRRDVQDWVVSISYFDGPERRVRLVGYCDSIAEAEAMIDRDKTERAEYRERRLAELARDRDVERCPVCRKYGADSHALDCDLASA